MLKLFLSVIKRIRTAVTNPFRMILVRIQRIFNVNVITAKLISPITKKVREMITLKPQSRKDYYVIGRFWVYKKLFMVIILALCAAVFIYFSSFATSIPKTAPSAATVRTDVVFDYNDMKLGEFSGVASIRSADGEIVYTGDVANGVCTGNGTLKDRSGNLLYEGSFLNNAFSGTGVLYYTNKAVRYSGEFSENLYSGVGKLFKDDGTLIYDGGFRDGLYDGTGKEYSQNGTLAYEGSYLAGFRHGQGIGYGENGALQYKGEYFNGRPQGIGELYGDNGRLLYSGYMHAGSINYEALLNSSYAEIRNAFSETPRLFYTDSESAFVFEQTGIIITVDCQVQVSTWEKSGSSGNGSSSGEGQYYYMPGEESSLSSSGANQGEPVPLGGETGTVVQALALEGSMVQLLEWYVSRDDEGSYLPPGSGTENSGGTETYGGDSGGSTGTEDTSDPLERDWPSFVDKNLTIFFQIDGSWASEDEMREKGLEEKVRVKKVTIFGGDLPVIPEGAAEYEDSAPPFLEDCVSIDYLRMEDPTLFSSVGFQTEQLGWSLVRVRGINYADFVRRIDYVFDNITYRYCFNEAGETKAWYGSIER